ncbi:hypothetical protein [Bacillus mesophilum]|uniref:Uncharacterized protein n=1 Tax=Bacillus mesophilum TaxID=1071718 RepID=A0A7V7UUX2_9BACI|nr:hypothetical protein [Bacillus mesophilum]KAB2332582.1 hypothetical protein F7732_10835 [Bacillus mesophilum]
MTAINEDNFEDFIAGFLLEAQALSKEEVEGILADPEDTQLKINVFKTFDNVAFLNNSKQQTSEIWSMYEEGIMELYQPQAYEILNNAVAKNDGQPLSPLQIAITWLTFQNK